MKAQAQPSAPPHIAAILDAAAARHNVEPALLRALCYVESRFNPNAVSPVGAKGLLQLMDPTAKDLGVSDPFNPEQNANAGAKYLAWLLDRMGGHTDEALAAYNWGFKRVEKRDKPWPSSVRLYVERIKTRANIERERGLRPVATVAGAPTLPECTPASEVTRKRPKP